MIQMAVISKIFFQGVGTALPETLQAGVFPLEENRKKLVRRPPQFTGNSHNVLEIPFAQGAALHQRVPIDSPASSLLPHLAEHFKQTHSGIEFL